MHFRYDFDKTVTNLDTKTCHLGQPYEQIFKQTNVQLTCFAKCLHRSGHLCDIKSAKVCIFVTILQKHVLILCHFVVQLMSVLHYDPLQLYVFRQVVTHGPWHKRGLSWPQKVKSMHFRYDFAKTALIFVSRFCSGASAHLPRACAYVFHMSFDLICALVPTLNRSAYAHTYTFMLHLCIRTLKPCTNTCMDTTYYLCALLIPCFNFDAALLWQLSHVLIIYVYYVTHFVQMCYIYIMLSHVLWFHNQCTAMQPLLCVKHQMHVPPICQKDVFVTCTRPHNIPQQCVIFEI